MHKAIQKEGGKRYWKVAKKISLRQWRRVHKQFLEKLLQERRDSNRVYSSLHQRAEWCGRAFQSDDNEHG